MQSVSASDVARRALCPHGAQRVALALVAATAIIIGMARLASAACPWIVQPEPETVAANGTVPPPAYDIVFDGLNQSSKVFYGFTVASLDLAWALTKQAALPPLKAEARRLQPKVSAEGTLAYQLAPDSIRPHTIYLVTANKEVRELEQIQARIQPVLPMAVSELEPKTRGGSDWSGPLPRQSVPGFEIAGGDSSPAPTGAARAIGPMAAAVQICAYQVATR
jgi:hypothetical protein